MKLVTVKRRERDVIIGLNSRNKTVRDGKRRRTRKQDLAWQITNKWFEKNCTDVLDIQVSSKQGVTIFLPKTMNFSSNYEITALCISAIRKLVKQKPLPKPAYRLSRVDFSKLKTISTSAALVLTAELSRWEDSSFGKLKPFEENWNEIIYSNFYEIGFFDLFEERPTRVPLVGAASKLNLVKYLKGRTGDTYLARTLKSRLKVLIGDDIDKWMFLRGGLDEAITNVTHHAYPEKSGVHSRHQNWYMTGSYVRANKELKVVFYDQGIGIPDSLPSWSLYERALGYLVKVGLGNSYRDENLIRASMELQRSSTGKSDRGKGLTDLLEFVKQRKNGYMAILSGKGLYKFTLSSGEKSVKTEGFENPIYGTIIIWCITLD